MPTCAKVQKELLSALPEHLEGTILELGSGWGTLAFALGRRYPNCQVIGFEISTIPYLISLLLQRITKQKNVTFKKKNFLKEPLSQATMLVCYLFPVAMQNLKDKLEKDGNNTGQLIVSHTFYIPGWKPEKTLEVPDLYHTKIFFYKSPNN